MINTVWVNADRGRDLHPLANHLQNFTKEENRDFSAFRFSLQLMFEQALTNLIICLIMRRVNQGSCVNRQTGSDV